MRLLLKKLFRFWTVINWHIPCSRFIVVIRDTLYVQGVKKNMNIINIVYMPGVHIILSNPCIYNYIYINLYIYVNWKTKTNSKLINDIHRYIMY